MHIVLIEPEIPQNTGSIARTCAANNIKLHLVGKLGFDISEKSVRRAGLDYWKWVDLEQHQSWDDFIQKYPVKFWLITKFAKQSYYQVKFSKDDALVFGRETKGLGSEFLDKYPDECKLRIPMQNENVRSLNLSNAVSIVSHEALRQFSIS